MKPILHMQMAKQLVLSISLHMYLSLILAQPVKCYFALDYAIWHKAIVLIP